jgi:hypothetical protein
MVFVEGESLASDLLLTVARSVSRRAAELVTALYFIARIRRSSLANSTVATGSSGSHVQIVDVHEFLAYMPHYIGFKKSQ